MPEEGRVQGDGTGREGVKEGNPGMQQRSNSPPGPCSLLETATCGFASVFQVA